MTSLCEQVLTRLEGKRLATAESLTGGRIGAALTAVPGASRVYAGGVVSYTDEVKHRVLGVPEEMLKSCGAVSAAVAQAMAQGAREALSADVAVSATGLAGPGGDDFGNGVGTVFIGYSDAAQTLSRRFLFTGNREQIRTQTVEAALKLILENQHPSENAGIVHRCGDPLA